MSRGRYAPSPTGEIHLGNASTALLAWLFARSTHGSFVMRIEDLDRGRCRVGMAEQILFDLRWLGLDWDEGPDVGGPHAPYVQSARFDRYASAVERLKATGRLYPCFCSRKEIAAAASAPQAPGDEAVYPGTCRGLAESMGRERIDAGERHAWRFRVETHDRPSFLDRVHGPQRCEAPSDFVVYRSDGIPAYHLAVVVDDAAMCIDEIVRGNDLLASTVRQLLLIEALGLDAPSYAHVPLILGSDGIRLSKRHRSVTLRELREQGFAAERIVGRLAWLVGLVPSEDPLAAQALLERFAIGAIGARGSEVRLR